MAPSRAGRSKARGAADARSLGLAMAALSSRRCRAGSWITLGESAARIKCRPVSEAVMPSSDPLLQPYQLKHLRLRNRLMSTAHEPAYTEDGMPKERYRLYHAEKAKGGIPRTMLGGSSVVAPDSPQVFGNITLYKDEVVPWLRELADAVHEHGAAVMIQITHLGRRTSWSRGAWLPVGGPSPIR